MNLTPQHHQFAAELERDHNAAYGEGYGTKLAKRYLKVIAKLPARPKSTSSDKRKRHPTEERILDALAERPMTKRELAEITKRTFAQVGAICNHLEREGRIKIKQVTGTTANLYVFVE